MPVIKPVVSATRPFWSVMIPSYNNAELLERTLASVLAQDPGPDVMQIEVVDDGSTGDDPAEVVERLGAGRVGFFRQPHNVGASANFTTCARRSQGRWVHVLHSDDLVLPRFYARYREVIEACPRAIMAAAQTFVIDVLGRYHVVTTPVEVVDGYVHDAAMTIATTHPLRCVSVVVARSAYEDWGGFHPGLFHANDWEMWTRLAARGPVAWVDEPLGLYRTHPESDSNRVQRSTAYIDDCVRAVDVIVGHFDVPDRRQARAGARRIVGDYATGVGLGLVAEGRPRLAVANAARAVRIDPSIHTWTRAMEVAGLSITRKAALTKATTKNRMRRRP